MTKALKHYSPVFISVVITRCEQSHGAIVSPKPAFPPRTGRCACKSLCLKQYENLQSGIIRSGVTFIRNEKPRPLSEGFCFSPRVCFFFLFHHSETYVVAPAKRGLIRQVCLLRQTELPVIHAVIA